MAYYYYFSTPENAPPLNQRRTIQMERSANGGFGFTLQVSRITSSVDRFTAGDSIAPYLTPEKSGNLIS
jgi:hypothetical protein